MATFSYVTPDTLGQVPASPYGGNSASWTSYKMVFDATSGLITATGSQANNNQVPEMIIDNGNKLGYYWIIEDV